MTVERHSILREIFRTLIGRPIDSSKVESYGDIRQLHERLDEIAAEYRSAIEAIVSEAGMVDWFTFDDGEHCGLAFRFRDEPSFAQSRRMSTRALSYRYQ